jgi:lysozyme
MTPTPVPIFKTVGQAVTFICTHEGFRAKPYKVGPFEKCLTIGFGTYDCDIKPSDVVTQAQARKMMMDDVRAIDKQIEAWVKKYGIVLKKEEWHAIASAIYNLGPIIIDSDQSTFAERMENGPRRGHGKVFKDEFVKWVKAGGKTMEGLVIRRNDEIKLATKGVYS